MELSQKRILLFLSFFIIILAIFVIFGANKPIKQVVVLSGKEFKADIAYKSEELEKGLSGREALPPGYGLLFVFDKPDKYGFWMKDMNFPIDMIWISDTNKIVGLQKSVSPSTYPEVFYPENNSLYVFEITGGQAELLNLKIGDQVNFIKK